MFQRPMLICFTGIDGSGKTTQAKLLVEWLESQGVKSVYVWSRGKTLAIRNIFLFLGRKALGTSAREIASDQQSYHQYQSRKSRLMRNGLVRRIWSAFTRAEHLLQINRDIRPKIREGNVVVCDRYFWDSAIDMAVLNHKVPASLLSGFNPFLWKLVPHPAITFLIDIPPEEAMKRKDDIPSMDYLRKRVEFYRFLAAQNSLVLVDGCEGVDEIQNHVRATVKSCLEG